ncbi:15064_t:CDS:1, partial [Gigaspora rosea]
SDNDNWDPRRWQSNQIKDELNSRRINYSDNASRLDLLNLLQKEMFFETTKELNERKNHLPVNDIVLAYTTEQS